MTNNWWESFQNGVDSITPSGYKVIVQVTDDVGETAKKLFSGLKTAIRTLF